MTDTQKIEKLVDLLCEVIELKQYDIENPHKSHQCQVEADAYYEKMMEILSR